VKYTSEKLPGPANFPSDLSQEQSCQLQRSLFETRSGSAIPMLRQKPKHYKKPNTSIRRNGMAPLPWSLPLVAVIGALYLILLLRQLQLARGCSGFASLAVLTLHHRKKQIYNKTVRDLENKFEEEKRVLRLEIKKGTF